MATPRKVQASNPQNSPGRIPSLFRSV